MSDYFLSRLRDQRDVSFAMGKPRDAVWAEYDKDATSHVPRAVCRHCGKRFTAIVQRMKTHLNRRCPACPADVKSRYAAGKPAVPASFAGFVLVPVPVESFGMNLTDYLSGTTRYQGSSTLPDS